MALRLAGKRSCITRDAIRILTYNDDRDTHDEKTDSFTLHASHGELPVHEPHEGVDRHEDYACRRGDLLRHSKQKSEDREGADVDTAGWHQTTTKQQRAIAEGCTSKLQRAMEDGCHTMFSVKSMVPLRSKSRVAIPA